MKENIKIALLGVIAVATVANLFKGSSSSIEEETETIPNSSAVATNVQANDQTAFTPNTTTPVNTEAVTTMPAPSLEKRTTIRWNNMVHDFGKVKQNSENKYAFTFTNSGTEPLVITNAVGSCGCTVPDYPKDPIAPGQSASIDVVYKPGVQENQQEKMVTVTANTDPIQTTLKIRAFVEK